MTRDLVLLTTHIQFGGEGIRGDLRIPICENDLDRFTRSGSQITAFDQGRREEAAAGPAVQQNLASTLGQLGGHRKREVEEESADAEK